MQTVQKLQKGFTLIELMIVVAIIGILAAVALPAYQDYVAKSKITSVVATMAAGKTAMFDRYVELGEMPDVSGAAADAIDETDSSSESFYNTVSGLNPNLASAITYAKTDSKTGTFTITLSKINGNVNGKKLEFAYADNNGELSFKCSKDAAPNDIKNKYLPKECQQ